MMWSALVLGLLGSFHCIGMCGPIAFLLPLDRKSKGKRVFQIISYHAGRLFTYAILGFIIGLLGKSFQVFGLQQQLSVIIGAAMICVVLIPSAVLNRYNFIKPIYKAVGMVKNKMGAKIKQKDPGTFFTIGFLNGLLPCGLVYMAIFGALGSGNAYYGAGYMALFGLGTIPLMTTAVYLGNFLKAQARQKIISIIPVFVVIVGALFILRGMGLGIQYISPSNEVAIEQVSSKHSCH